MAADAPRYRDPEAPLDHRVADLLDRMTLAEKAGQLVGTWGGHLGDPHDLDDVREAIVEYGIGAAAPFGWGGSIGREPREIATMVNDLQDSVIEETRLGIPVLFNVDAVHGHAYVAGATVFPHGLSAAATRDVELIERAASITATEVRATGAGQNYAPVADVGRDPRWGRMFETFGESPTLTAAMTAAKVRGYQGDGIGIDDDAVVSTVKHFPAYSKPARGEDASPVEVSDYLLRRVFLPPFEAAIDAGVESVMPCYNSINGEAVHGSRTVLTRLLREELGFDGTVVSDWGGVAHLHQYHATAADHRGSVAQARRAGLDVASVGHVDHRDHLLDLVERGDLAEATLEESVRRVLSVKFRLGLFENPYVNPDDVVETLGRDDHRDVARTVARRSMTLLENDGLLPFSGDEDVFVGGPNADTLVHLLGGWSVETPDGVPGATVREAIEARADGDVSYVQGSTLNETLDVEAAAHAAADADVAVLVLGEGWYLHEFGAGRFTTETGAWPTRSDMRLADAQRELAQAIHATGTSIVGVLVTGRPLIVDWLADYAAALLFAGFPGTEGGHAIAEMLYGDVNPSGALAASIPRDEGDLPQHHDYHRHPTPIGPDEHPDSYDPLYPFGHGLSYTTFAYRDLSVSPAEVGPSGTATVSVDVENVGDRAGRHVVDVFLSDRVSSRVRPDREHCGFGVVALEPGETGTVTVDLGPGELGFVAADGERVVEPGMFDVSVGDLTDAIEVRRRDG